LKTFVKKILLIVNSLLALSLFISYLSVNVSPANSWIFAFLALAYPVILILNILFILWWLIFRKWYFLISVLSILLGWHALQSSFQFHFSKPDAGPPGQKITVLTYNVRLFNYYHWNKDTSAWQRITSYIRTEKPDIVCFQEFITLPGTNHDLENLKRRLKPLSYSHVYYTDHVKGKLNFGMATFSKFPIINKKMIDFEESLNGSMYSDIVAGHDTIRLFNCHLQSIRLRKEYNDLLDSLIFNYSDKHLHDLKDISVRMRQAYIMRAGQVNKIRREINASPYPVIVCGDFNDTPVSYAYKIMSKGLKDVFIHTGSGIGTTFRGNFPYVRIDYVFCSPELTPVTHKIGKIKLSDHYPVKADFVINEKAGSADPHSRPTK
jgi:endonuclease/exonuclease/phosphatase family metal-dependent hydrolase